MNLILFAVATTGLVVRAYTRKSLTIGGILAAILTACIHALHPSNTPFLLLITFYTLGTVSTKIKHDIKSRLTLSATGEASTQRTHVQVFCNSVVASILTLLAAALAASDITKSPSYRVFGLKHTNPRDVEATAAARYAEKLMLLGVVFNYAATAADTLSSELGILSPSPPRLILSGRVCPPGTNGGVTFFGLLAGAAGAAVIALTALASGVPWSAAATSPSGFIGLVVAAGVAGSILDSVLGAVFQETVVDTRTGKVVEAPGGGRVLVQPGERRGSFKGEARTQIGYAPEKRAEELEAEDEGAVKAVGLEGQDENARRRRHVVEDRGEVDVDEVVGRRGKSREVFTGMGWLDNNMVNLTMAGAVALGGMVVVGGPEGVVTGLVKGATEVGKLVL